MFGGFSQITQLSSHLRFIGSFLGVTLFGILGLPLGFHRHGDRFLLAKIGVEASLSTGLVMVGSLLYGLTIGSCRVICVICSFSRFYQLLVFLGMPGSLILFMMACRLSYRVVWSFSMFVTLSLHICELGFSITLFRRVIFLARFLST